MSPRPSFWSSCQSLSRQLWWNASINGIQVRHFALTWSTQCIIGWAQVPALAITMLYLAFSNKPSLARASGFVQFSGKLIVVSEIRGCGDGVQMYASICDRALASMHIVTASLSHFSSSFRSLSGSSSADLYPLWIVTSKYASWPSSGSGWVGNANNVLQVVLRTGTATAASQLAGAQEGRHSLNGGEC